MAREVRTFSVTVGAGTPASAPVTVDLAMPPRIVDLVRFRVPPGPSGLVGFALGSAGTPVVPWNAGAWIVADNEVLTFPLEDGITSGAWQLRAYNTGTFAHTIQVLFQLRTVGDRSNVAAWVPLTITP
jgi:hypothetical protein